MHILNKLFTKTPCQIVSAGELGPGTIVGSAAFNLMIIAGICIVAIPDGETRRIKGIRVFGVTAVFSLLAYVWLVVVLVAVSPDEVSSNHLICLFKMGIETRAVTSEIGNRIRVPNFLAKIFKTKVNILYQ